VNNRVLLLVSAFSFLMLGLATTAVGVASAARLNLSSGVFAATFALFVLGVLTGAVAWLLGLMRTARDRRWEWFVEIFMLGALGVLVFSVVTWSGEAVYARSVAN
jgi:predicted acyltransferase